MRRARIEGYKALIGLDINVPSKLLFLIGANGSGKSSVLQALAFIQYFTQGKSGGFFDDRGWSKQDIRSRVNRASPTISYELLLESSPTVSLIWKFGFGLATGRLVREEIWVRDKEQDDEPRRLMRYIRNPRPEKQESSSLSLNSIRTEGSILGLFEPGQISAGNEEHLEAILLWGKGVTSLELLSPTAMKGGARGVPNDIGPRGERLAGFLANLSARQRSRLVERLSKFYKIENIETTKKRAGWVDLRIAERFKGLGPTSATHMSDGFLRLLALCAVPEFDEHVSLVLLDEVEDGIEPHILPHLIRAIARESKAQLVLTSHSPLLINFFEPNEVEMLARSSNGITRSMPLTEIDAFRRGAEFFGSGEIWANSSLNSITKGISGSRRQDMRSRPRFDIQAARAFMDGQ